MADCCSRHRGPQFSIICGHVFCSFLALVLRDELFRRMDNAGVSAEWADILRDLDALSETTITYNGKRFVVRSNAVGVAGKIAQCVPLAVKGSFSGTSYLVLS